MFANPRTTHEPRGTRGDRSSPRVNISSWHVEGTGGPALSNGHVMARLPYDGHDENNNITDFLVVTGATPNELNFP